MKNPLRIVHKHRRYASVLLFLTFFMIQMVMGFSFSIRNNASQKETDQKINIIQFSSADDQINLSSIIEQLPRPKPDENLSWDRTQYRMLIICPPNPDYIASANEFAAWKSYRGIPTAICSNYSSYNGSDPPEKIRNAIISYYNTYKIEWVLIFGSPSIIPMRYVYNPDTEIVNGGPEFGSVQKPTDFYYADLTGNWNYDGDGNWGELHTYNDRNNSIDEMDWIAEVAVGRFPVDSISELRNVINKTMNYEKAMNPGIWMNRYLAVSTILNDPSSEDLDGEDEARVGQYVIDNFVNNKMTWGHLLEHTAYFQHPESFQFQQLTSGNVLSTLNQGASIMQYGGHGAPGYFSSKTAGAVFGTESVDALENTSRPTMVFADACDTNAFDTYSLGKKMILHPESGAIGYIGAMRISWYFSNDSYLEQMNRGVTRLFFEKFFYDKTYEQGKALYESKEEYVNSTWFDSLEKDYKWWVCEQKTITSYLLLGDPSVDIFTNQPMQFGNLIASNTPLYEGSIINLIIKDNNSQIIPYAYVTFFSADGKYHSYQAGEFGNLTVRLPLDARNYTYTLFGHNMFIANGSIKVHEDKQTPLFVSNPEVWPENPTVDNDVKIEIDMLDTQSGISDGYAVLSPNNYKSLLIYPVNIEDLNTPNHYWANLSKMDYDDYRYMIIVFDYAENYNTTLYSNPQLNFTIPIPWQLYVLLLSNSLLGIFIILLMKKHLQKLNKKLLQEYPQAINEIPTNIST